MKRALFLFFAVCTSAFLLFLLPRHASAGGHQTVATFRHSPNHGRNFGLKRPILFHMIFARSKTRVNGFYGMKHETPSQSTGAAFCA